MEVIDYRPDNHARKFDWSWRRLGLNNENIKRAMVGKKYSSFLSKYIKLTSQTYRSYEELAARPPEADAYITGSDQVWNSEVTQGLCPAYFLAFAPKGAKRISYAASFGANKIAESEYNILKKYLQDFTAISVREVSGVKLLKDYCSIDSCQTCDPTFLLEDYSEIIEPMPIDYPYLMVYSLQAGKDFNRAVRLLSDHYGYPIINGSSMGPLQKSRSIGKEVWPSPGQLLSLITNASGVVTNSFHGTVFSTMNHRNLFVLKPTGNLGKRFVRISELLQYLNLEDRTVDLGKPLSRQITEIMHHKADWTHADQQLCQIKEKSRTFLDHALS